MTTSERTGRIAIIDGAEWEEWQTVTVKYQQRYYTNGERMIYVLPKNAKIKVRRK